MASELEESRQEEDLGHIGMLKCLGNNNALAGEFISFLTTLKNTESVVAYFGDKKSEVVSVIDHACGQTLLPTGRLGVRS